MRFFIIFISCFLIHWQVEAKDSFAMTNTPSGHTELTSTSTTYSDPLYNNKRFNFSLSWLPGKYSVKESDNGDGVTVSDDQGFTLLAYGTHSYMVMGQSMEEALAELSFGLEVTYKRINTEKKWFVVSGFQGRKIVYIKCFFNKDAACIVHISYPKQKANIYEPQVQKVVQSFK